MAPFYQRYRLVEDMIEQVGPKDYAYGEMYNTLTEMKKKFKFSESSVYPVNLVEDRIKLIDFLKRKQKPTVVYFLYDKGLLVYIGVTCNLDARIRTHMKSKVFDSLAFFECSPKNIVGIHGCELEWFLLELYKTRYNKLPFGLKRKHDANVKK